MQTVDSQQASSSALGTLAALAAAPGPAQACRIVLEETDAPYEFVPGDATASNGWTSIAPTGGTPGRWLLRSDRISIAPIDNVVNDWIRASAAFVAIADKSALTLRANQGQFIAATAGAKLPSGSTIKLVGGTKIKSTLVGGANFDGPINAGATTTANVGTLNANVVVGSRTLSVNLPAPPTVGNALLVSLAANPTCQAVYDIVNVVGAVSPFTVTVDRPIVWAFLATAAITELSDYPKRITIDGNGGRTSGTGNQSVQASNALQFVVRGLHYVAGDGVVVGTAFGWDVACQEGLLEDFSVDQANASAGVYFQSNERSNMRNGKVRNSGSGYALFDCYQCGIEDAWNYNGTAVGVSGITMDQISANGFGCFECWIRGGGSVGGAGTSVALEKAVRCIVDGFYADGGINGFNVGLASDSRLTNIVARNMSGRGLLIGVTAVRTMVNGYQAESCNVALDAQAGSTDTYVSDVSMSTCTTLITASADLTVDGFVGVVGASDGAAPIVVLGGNFTLVDAHITCQKAAASVIQVSAGVARLRDLRIEMTVGANQTGLYLTGGETFLENVRVTGIASSFNLYVAAGATCWIGDGCDFATGGNPVTVVAGGFLNEGNVALTGAVAVPVAFPAIKATSIVTLTLAVRAGVPGTEPAVVITPGVGFTVTGIAADTSTYAYKIT